MRAIRWNISFGNLTQRLSCTSLIGFVKSIDTGDAGKVRHRFAVPGKDVMKWAEHESREAQF